MHKDVKYIIKSNIKEVMLKYGDLTPDVRGLTLEDYLIDCVLEESTYRKFKYEDYNAPIEANIILGTVLQTNHPMPYENVPVSLPMECLEKIN